MASIRKVLIVDDSNVQRQQMRVTLEACQLKVIEAEDGIQGLQAIRDNQDLAIIFCDINMPRMNGLELLETVKNELLKEEGLKYVPIVILTTEAEREMIAKGKAAGAAGWLIKPAKDDHIKKLVNVFIK